jgi:hypothetical protein
MNSARRGTGIAVDGGYPADRHRLADDDPDVGMHPGASRFSGWPTSVVQFCPISTDRPDESAIHSTKEKQ